MTDQNKQKQEQTHKDKASVKQEDKSKDRNQDELTIEELAKVSGGRKRSTTFGRS